MMKKTLVAMAACALLPTAYAQVTLTGTFATGYKSTKATGTNAINIPGLGLNNVAAVAGADSSGLGVDTSQVDIAVKEDLGGGQQIEAKMSFAGLDRSGESSSTGSSDVSGRDATLTYTNNSFGQIQMGTTKGAAELSGIASADAPVIDMDGKLFEIRSSNDSISYAAPIGPLFFQYKLSESSNGIGLGQGTSGPAGTKVGQRTSDYALAYLTGPFKAVAAIRTYDNRESTSFTTSLGLTKDQSVAVELGYDAGFAKFGVGYVSTTATVGARVQDMLAGVSVPVGSWVLGATFSQSITSGVADVDVAKFPNALFKAPMSLADGTGTGFSLGAKYNLSKRTNMSVKYASWVRSGYEQFEAWGARAATGASIAALNEFGYSDRATETSILLSHSF